MKNFLTIVFCLAYSFGYAQIYDDYIGAGHSDGITVTSSNSSGDAEDINTINGAGMDARLFEASRFLAQTTFGSTKAEIEDLAVDLDFEAWIDNQIALPTTQYLPEMEIIWDEIYQLKIANGEAPEDIFGPYALHWNYTWWQNVMTKDDQLRMRVADALSQILVISNNSDIRDFAESSASYHDVLMEHAFGNYEDLLLAVTLHPSMGYYLSHFDNPKEVPEENIHPDQNYAREIMQLFSIGLYELNIDGTRKQDANGNDIPTYDQDDIVELADVFTGLGASGIEDYVDWTTEPYFGLGFWGADKVTPMAMYEEFHEPSEKIILKTNTIPAGQPGMTDVEQAVNILFNHDNVAPFVALRLIQRLIKSNPTPGYITRIANVFNNNGSGLRGDLQAVIKAIYLDEEARECAPMQDDFSPRLREPIQKYTHISKSIETDSPLGRYWNNGYNYLESTKQHPLWAPTVFNFYLPDHFPVGVLSGNGYYSPEFKLHNTQTATSYINEVNAWTVWDNLMYSWEGSYGDVSISLITTELEALADDPEKLIHELDILFTHGQLTDETREIIRNAITPLEWGDYTYDRARMALYLLFISPDYNIMK